MCFSETASFGLAATLTPIGLYCTATARKAAPRFLLLAAFPLAFATQQVAEGFVWHGLNIEDARPINWGALGFVFFSHFFWLFFAPAAVLMLEVGLVRRRILWLLTIFGALFGLTLFLPLALDPSRLEVHVVQHSIEYRTVLVYDGLVSRTVVRAVYSAIIVGALLVASRRDLQLFGVIILISVILAALFFSHAFISVWCFLAAVLSLYVLYVVRNASGLPPATPQRHSASA